MLVAEGASFAAGLLNPGPEDVNPNSSTDELARALKGLGSKTLYRGDSRGLTEIFREGFEAQGSNTDLIRYVEENIPSVFIGTSKSINEAAKKGTNGYVYLIDNSTGDGFDVKNFFKAIGETDIHEYEQEVVFEGLINARKIIGAIKVGEKGELSNTLILHPRYNYKAANQ